MRVRLKLSKRLNSGCMENQSQNGRAGHFMCIEERPISVNRLGFWLLCWIGVWLPGFAMAAGPPAEVGADKPVAAQNASDARPAEANDAPVPVKPQLTAEQKRKAAVVSSLLMVGLLAMLLCLFLWMLWWSRRTHRLLRQPLPAVKRGDELWYLKGKQPPGQTSDPPTPNSPPAPPPV